MIVETPRPTLIALPINEDDPMPMTSSCPGAPYLPSCSNFHQTNPVSLAQHRFCYSSEDSETPVQLPFKKTTGLSGNLLGLFFEERDKGVLQAAIERIEVDPRYSSVFEEDEEFDDFNYTYDLTSPSTPPLLIRRGSGYTSSDSSNGDFSPPPPIKSWRTRAYKVSSLPATHIAAHFDNDTNSNVEIVTEQTQHDEAGEDAFAASLMSWRIPAYLREPESGCTSSASTPSFCSLTPVPYDNLYHSTEANIHGHEMADAYTYTHNQCSTSDTYPYTHTQPYNIHTSPEPFRDMAEYTESLSAPPSWKRRPSLGENPEKRRKLHHRNARVINGSLFS